ncbi:hypothetical protein AAMO2058_000043400 [Amorphochlora amoebiformis]
MFSGPLRAKHQAILSYRTNIRDPILAGGFIVKEFVTTSIDQIPAWKVALPEVEIGISKALTPYNQTLWSLPGCKAKGCRAEKHFDGGFHGSYWKVWSHVNDTYHLLMEYEEKHDLKFAYGIHTRIDLVYSWRSEAYTFNPYWLPALGFDEIGSAYAEFHNPDSWCCSEWGYQALMADQFVMGRREAIGKHLNMMNNERIVTTPVYQFNISKPMDSIEGYLRRNVILNNLTVVCVPLAFGKNGPKGKFNPHTKNCPRLEILKQRAEKLKMSQT